MRDLALGVIALLVCSQGTEPTRRFTCRAQVLAPRAGQVSVYDDNRSASDHGPAARRPARPGAQAGRVRRPPRCCPADYLDLVDPLRSGADLRGRIEAVQPETRDAATIVIRPGRGWQGHTPGQYIRIGIDVDGVRQWRAYSLTSDLDPHRRLHHRHRQGDPRRQGEQPPGAPPRARARSSSSTRPPASSCLPAQRPDKALFVTAGSGHHPGHGHAAQPAAELDRRRPRALGARPPDDVIFGAELRALAADGRIRLVEQHTDTAGMLDAAAIAELVPDLAERSTWACGPVGMLEALEEHWAAAGIADRLYTERFRPRGPGDRRGRHGHVREVRHRRGGRRRDADPRRRRGRRAC